MTRAPKSGSLPGSETSARIEAVHGSEIVLQHNGTREQIGPENIFADETSRIEIDGVEEKGFKKGKRGGDGKTDQKESVASSTAFSAAGSYGFCAKATPAASRTAAATLV